MNNKIIIATGGTGGHIFPAQATALKLSEDGFRVLIAGNKNYYNYHDSDRPYSCKIIAGSQIKKGFLPLIKSAIFIGWGVLQSLFLMLRKRPSVVVAFGGYATFPVLIAAVILRIKIILHEQNAHLGKVNRLFAKFACKIALSYSKTSGVLQQYLPKVELVGNPIRQEIADLSREKYQAPNLDLKPSKIIKKDQNAKNMGYNVVLASELEEESEKLNANYHQFFNILVVGGSGGAKIFSDVLPKAFFNMNSKLKNHINITQQCRADDIDVVFNQYKDFNLNVTVKVFFEDMPEQIKKAHLIIARAGSSSIAEFTAAAKPMILIPFAAASDDHQRKNAKFLSKKNAAVIFDEKELTINKITSCLDKLIGSQSALEKMSKNSLKCANLSATRNFAQLIKNSV